MIAVVDYEAGNAPSVVAALRHIGHEGSLVSTREELEAADKIILPGVGSAGATLDSLKKLDLLGSLESRTRAGVPFLGICVGLQVLFDHSEEGDVPCLGWFRGRVRRFSSASVRVPQIGWNSAVATRSHPILEGVPRESHFYFVNSYYVVPEDADLTLCGAEYGVPFTAMIARDNVFATQFHVEKSGPLGLQILRNFVKS
jgi:glutamine amidotransferase